MSYVKFGVGSIQGISKVARKRSGNYIPVLIDNRAYRLPNRGHTETVLKQVRSQPWTGIVLGWFGAEPRAPAVGVSRFKHEENHPV